MVRDHHPCDDGNGRVARAISDLARVRCDGTDTCPYSMSTEIMRQRESYYRASASNKPCEPLSPCATLTTNPS